MINENVKKWLDAKGLGDRLTEHAETIDTVEHAAIQVAVVGQETQITIAVNPDNTAGPFILRPIICDVSSSDTRTGTLSHTRPLPLPHFCAFVNRQCCRFTFLNLGCIIRKTMKERANVGHRGRF